VSLELDRLTAALAGRYAIKRELGAGGMATVYLADDVRHRRQVAVKVLRPDLAATLGPERFFREIEIAAQLQHPHILPLLDSGQSDGFLFYVMPFVEGESLRERLTRVRELPIPEAVRLLRDVADALSHAHARGVVHRDIKPENVMLTGRHALVMDFGVAKAVSEAKGHSNLTTAGVALGTPAYMSPEQAAADPNVDHRADIYALGAMGYELVAGRPPFQGTTPQQLLAMHVTQEPDPVSRYRPGIPPALESVIMRCLVKRAADRWQSADEVVERLESLGPTSGGMTPTHTQPTTAVPMPGQWYGHPLRTAGLFLLGALAVLGAVYFLTIQLGLPDWVPWGALGLLAVGLPIMVVTGLAERRRAKLKATGMWSLSGETGMHRQLTWKKATRGGVLAFAGLALLAVVYTIMRVTGIGPVGTLVASGRLAEKDRLILADFENRTSDSTLGRSVTEAFRIDLSQSPVVSLVGASDVGAALQRMSRDPKTRLDAAVAREVALREGAKGIVLGEISPIGKGMVLSARLVAPDGAELVAVRETAADDGEILGAIDRLSKRVRERIGESLRTIRANDPLDEVTTGSLEALRLYSEGARIADHGENERGIVLLKQAVALDSGFAMAWRKLAVVLPRTGAGGEEILLATSKAYQYRERLPDVERYHTEAWYYDNVLNDRERAISAYRAILEIKPDDPIAPVNLANLLGQNRQWSEQERLARQVIEAGDDMGTAPWNNLIGALMAQGKQAEAWKAVDDWSRIDSTGTGPMRMRSQMYASARRYDSASAVIAEYARTATEASDQSFALRFANAVAEVEGRLAEGDRQRRAGRALWERRGVSRWNLVTSLDAAQTTLRLRGDSREAARMIEQALAESPLTQLSPLDRPYLWLSSLYSELGQPEKARRMIAEYKAAIPDSLRRNDIGLDGAQGDLSLAEGRPREALASYRRAWEQSGCTNCTLADIGRAFDALGETDSAIAYYRKGNENPPGVGVVFRDRMELAPSYRRLGELYEAKGDKQAALDFYGRFTDLWKNADTELQPQVAEIRRRMAKLAGE
jgi:tetratricopeptide (TPR) repeat protein